VPEGYPAYGRLLHPAASTDPGGPERWRWADIAAKRNYHLGPELRFNDLVGWDVSVTADPPPPYHAPDRGSLDETSCRALAEILPAFTTRPDLCWYCLWGGYGWPELPAPGAGPPRVTCAGASTACCSRARPARPATSALGCGSSPRRPGGRTIMPGA
jgi:hypothetical protein